MFDKSLAGLTKAYGASFIGDTAVYFVKYLERIDNEERTNKKQLYAKAVPVVQSSGTGKSRMLTEVCSVFLLSCQATKFLLGWETYIYASNLPSPAR